jgi:hypothetical protein
MSTDMLLGRRGYRGAEHGDRRDVVDQAPYGAKAASIAQAA